MAYWVTETDGMYHLPGGYHTEIKKVRGHSMMKTKLRMHLNHIVNGKQTEWVDLYRDGETIDMCIL